MFRPSSRGGFSGAAYGARSLRQAVEDVPPEVGVGHLAAPEHDGHLDPVPLREEPHHVALLEVVVVHLDLRPHLDLLDLDDPLVLLRLLGLLRLAVLELAEVQNAADGGHGGGGDLHQVEIAVPRGLDGVVEAQDTELVALVVDHPHLPGANLPVDPLLGRCNHAHATVTVRCPPCSLRSPRNSSRLRVPTSPCSRRRTATLPSACSRAPSIAMKGTFCNCASRIL